MLEAVQDGNAEKMSTGKQRWYQIERFLKKHGTITSADVREMLGVSPAAANRVLAKMAGERDGYKKPYWKVLGI